MADNLGRLMLGFSKKPNDPLKPLWTRFLSKCLFTKLRNTASYYDFWNGKATKSRLEENQLRKSLAFWQVQLHSDPHDEVNKAHTKDCWA